MKNSQRRGRAFHLKKNKLGFNQWKLVSEKSRLPLNEPYISFFREGVNLWFFLAVYQRLHISFLLSFQLLLSVFIQNYSLMILFPHQMKVVKYQDELEAGRRSRKPRMSISQQVEAYRQKLLNRVSYFTVCYIVKILMKISIQFW